MEECKMQSDPVHFSNSGLMDEAVPQETLARSFHCTICMLIFKSKVYLFEHLNKVHCLDVDTSLRKAGLKYADSKNPNVESSRSLRKSFTCGTCDFKTFSRETLTKHETQCQKTDNPDSAETIIISDSPDMEMSVALTDDAEEAPSSKDLKTYKRPPQTIAKYFAASSGSSKKVKLVTVSKETLILVDAPPEPNLPQTAVSKATAKPGIDVSHRGTDSFLQSDHLYHAELEASDPLKEQTNIAINEINRKTNNESLKAPNTKKPKLEKERKLAQAEKTNRKLSGEFSFEVSDDDEEKKADSVKRDPSRPKVYFCKHCDFSNVSFRLVSSHYRNHHPYVRCSSAYIQHSVDQTATFRCLECPIEFLSTVDLKWHYTEKHPEAPDMFKMNLNEVTLVFKCFTCTYACDDESALKQHYKEKHPACEMDNSLLFCQYLASGRREEPFQLETCEKTSSPERPLELSPKRTSTPHKEVEITPSHQPSASTRPDVTPYKCSKCEFEHKSAVVMHVHYQKKHPEKPVSIDEIKQLANESPQTTPEKGNSQEEKAEVHIQEEAAASVLKLVPETSKRSSDILRVVRVESLEDDVKKGKSPSKRLGKTTIISEDLREDGKVPSQRAKSKPELQGGSAASPREHILTASKKTSGFSAPKHVKSAKNKSKAKTSPSKPKTESTTSKFDKLLCSSPLEMHYCQFCDYSSPQIRSVIGHHNAKHAVHALLSKEDIIQYSSEVMENKLKNQTLSKTSNHVKKSNKVEVQLNGSGASKKHAYADAEKLFFCHLCNFGNPTIQGIIAHQNRVHKYPHSNQESILEYTASIHEKIKKSKSQEKNPTSLSHLPLPIISKGDKEKFFCPVCNYRNREFTSVSHHCSRVHPSVSNTVADIRRYTSEILGPGENQELPEKAESKKEKTFPSSVPLSLANSATQRKLPCKYCTFTSQYVFTLRSHMRKIHFSKPSVSAVLRLCFRKGALESGYHCEWCVFSHTKAEIVYKHYQDKHPGCKQMSLGNIKARLFVGPNSLNLKDKKTEAKSAHQALTSQKSEKTEGEIYPCKVCSFKSHSKLALTRHCNNLHSSPAKEKLSDPPSDKRERGKSQLEDLNEMPGLFESFQVPLEDPDQESSPSALFKCPSCPATFDRKHGLSVHCGIKHLEAKNVKWTKKQAEKTQGQVFKCPYCSYFNTSFQGVHTHCQFRHPTSTARAENLDMDPAQLQGWDDYMKRTSLGETLKYSGYICKTCPQVCATLKKLKRHCEKDHNETAPGLPKPVTKPSLGLKIKLAKPLKTHKSVTKHSLLTKKVYTRLKCQQCSYVCSTNIALSKHMLQHHADAAPKDSVYDCMLCPQTYSFKNRLAKHYLRLHGRTAYLKHYAAVYRPGQKKQESASQQQQNTTKDKRLIFKCPSCPYVNITHHGTLTHSQMKHPDVFVRADALEMGEIIVSNIIMCSKGKGSYERGYLCKRCPQIHPSIKKLMTHCQNEHGKAAVSELFTRPEVIEKRNKTSPVAEATAAAIKTTTQKSDPLEREHKTAAASDRGAAVSDAAPSSTTELKKDLFYKCQLCTYETFSRRNLQSHYKGCHKLDALNTYKLLEKYNKRKNNFLLKYIESKKQLSVKCKKCPDSIFDSSQLLIDHYNTFHQLASKSDFMVLSFGVKKGSTGIYKCKYCKVHLYGIRKLCRHLDRHRDRIKLRGSQRNISFGSGNANPQSHKVPKQNKNKLPSFESVKELSQWTGTSVEVVALSSSPQLSPSKLPDVEPEPEPQEEGHTCRRCQRTFMSLKGLRSHERSHAALGAIKKLDNLLNTEFKHNIKKYVFHKPETLKPFRCGCCAYQTSFMALWQSHFLKNHQDIIEKGILESSSKDEEISQTPDQEITDSSEKMTNSPEFNEDPMDVEESTESYSEPPDVQRQLTHYSLMAQNVDKTNMNLHELSLSGCLLQCEMCNFNTEHLSSIRRHYANRHGKKILRCKDCEFFTGVRKNMEMHIETGHSTCQSKPTHLKDLRCPFCLYQTKNKNNMIDHIVLHREERVVPIEVRRPKLSRYLQGIVFRCHKCTFTSGSAENLRLHVMRHDDVKPYKCRLCYFDCTQLTDLEAHLSDKHQVLRNHELVGQVSLDQLEARTGTRPEKDNDHKSDIEELEGDEFNNDFEDVPQTDIPEYHATNNLMLPIKEEEWTQEQEENEGIPTNSSVSDIMQPFTQQNTTVLKRHKEDSQTQRENLVLDRQRETNAEECSNPGIKDDGCSFAEKEGRKSPNKTTLMDRQELAEADVQAKRLHFQEGYHKAQNIEAMVEDDVVRHVLLLHEHEGMDKSHRRPGQERSGKTAQNTEAHGEDDKTNDKPLSNNVCGTSLALNHKFQDNIITNSVTAKMNSAQGSNSKSREGFRFEPHLLTLSPNYTRLKLGHGESFCRLLTNCKKEQKHTLKIPKDESGLNTDKTVLEECVKDEQPHLEKCEENEANLLDLRLDEEMEINKKNECEVQDAPLDRDDALTTMDGATELLHEKLFTCELCGRNLMSISELNRHVMRHGV